MHHEVPNHTRGLDEVVRLGDPLDWLAGTRVDEEYRERFDATPVIR